MTNYSVLMRNGFTLQVDRVEKAIPQFIRCLLLRLREVGLSYSQIGSMINADKGTTRKLINGEWYPKTRRAQNILLSNVFKIKISDFEELKGEETGDARGIC